MKIAIIGASGQVGHNLLIQAARRGHKGVGTRNSFPVPKLAELDLSDRDAVRDFLRAQKPDAVFCTAAWSHVDGCELEPDKSLRLNVTNTLNAAQAAKEVGARFAWFSSDYVFPGEDGFYSEESPIRPLSVYGEHKARAEREILELDDNSLVLRTAVVYGPSQQRKNTIYQLIRAHLDDQPFKVPVDQICNPTYSPNLAAASIELLERGASGIYHVAGPETISRHEFALMACMILKLNEGILEPVVTSAGDRPAPRPLNNGLDVSKAQAALRCPLMGCAEGLSAFNHEAPPLAAVIAERGRQAVAASRALPASRHRGKSSRLK